MPQTVASPRLLLIVTLSSVDDGARSRISLALQALGCGELREGVYLANSALRRPRELSGLAEHCAREGGVVWLMAERSTHGNGEAYAPLVDRSAEHAASLESWRKADGPLPSLAPGEMVRL